MLRSILDRLFSDRRSSRPSTRGRKRAVRSTDRRRMFLETLENRSLLAGLATDALDYSPGADVIFSGSGFAQGETIDVAIVSDIGTGGSLAITDGGEGDDDGAAD